MAYADSCRTLDEAPAIADAHVALNEAFDLSQRVGRLVDRLLGAVPAPAPATIGGDQVSDAVFPALRDHSRSTSGCIREAQEALNRLERALP